MTAKMEKGFTWLYRLLIGAVLTVGLNYGLKSYEILVDMYNRTNNHGQMFKDVYKIIEKHEARFERAEIKIYQNEKDISVLKNKHNIQ